MTGQVHWIKPVVFGDPGGPLDAPTPRTHRVIVRLCLSGPQVGKDLRHFLLKTLADSRPVHKQTPVPTKTAVEDGPPGLPIYLHIMQT